MNRFIQILCIVLGTATSALLMAQEVRKCGASELKATLLAAHPEIARQLAEIERQTNSRGVEMRGADAITIPVVVHIVYRTEAENISDAQVRSQIDVLNRDYGRQNVDITKVPTEFAGVAADCDVRFQLAARTPEGEPTNGIVRRHSLRTTWGAADHIKKPSMGGFAPWNPEKYLNIYVCNIGDGVLGYASFPGAPAASDGVVIDYTAFGTMGTARAPFNKGRTTTHEVGHYLNLLHIWGDAECGDDHVHDTPEHREPHYGCTTAPSFGNCSGTRVLEMPMNFMDYSNDDCMYMFTAGQKARIQSILAPGGVRRSLATSDGCVPPSTAACTALGLTAGHVTASTAVISWAKVAEAAAYEVHYKSNLDSEWTIAKTTQNALMLKDLEAAMTYEVRVKSICSEQTLSTVLRFMTAPQGYTPQTATASKLQQLLANSFQTFPNPVAYDLNLTFHPELEGDTRVRILDANGIVKFDEKVSVNAANQHLQIDMSAWANGLYLVVVSQNEVQTTKKVLKTQ